MHALFEFRSGLYCYVWSTAIFPTREVSILRATCHLFFIMSHKTLLALKKHHFFEIKALVLIPIGMLLSACESTLERTVFDGQTMGTTYRITLTTEEPVGTGVKASSLPISIKS